MLVFSELKLSSIWNSYIIETLRFALNILNI